MIYVVAEDADCGPVKIGYTSGVPFNGAWRKGLLHRLCGLNIGNHRELFVIALSNGTAEQEQGLHGAFKEWRIRGEWFERAGLVLDFVEKHRCATIRADRRRRPYRSVDSIPSKSDMHIRKILARAWSEEVRAGREKKRISLNSENR